MEADEPVDLVFQSSVGTGTANKSFGIDLSLSDADRYCISNIRPGGLHQRPRR